MLTDLAILINAPHCDCNFELAYVQSELLSVARRHRREGAGTGALPCSLCAVLFGALQEIYHHGMEVERFAQYDGF